MCLLLAATGLRAPLAAAPPLHAYVGTYTGQPDVPTGAPLPGSRNFAHGRGIYLVDIEPETGAMSAPRLVAQTPSPTWLTIDPARGVLYAANGGEGGAASAFRIDPATHELSLINTQPTGGVPVYVALAGGGAYLLAANYGGGSVAVLPIRADGGLARATDIRATLPGAPPQPPSPTHRDGDAPSAVHMARGDHRGRFIVANDSMQDRVFVWRLDPRRGTLIANDPPFFAMPRGAFPRHFAFSPDDRHFYDLDERGGMLRLFDMALIGDDVRLTPVQQVPTLAADFRGRAQGSELLISRDGRYLYAGNRSDDTIASFAAARDGRLTALGEVATQGDHPRSLAFDPAERFLFSLNQRGDSITVFRRDPASGRLQYAGQSLRIPSPAAMVFAP